MRASLRSLTLAGVLAVGCGLGFGATPANAQAFGFSYASPGLSFGVGSGALGYPYYGGYPLVGAPVVAAPVVAAPLVVPRPVVVPAPYRYYGPVRYGYGYRPYGPHHGWYR